MNSTLYATKKNHSQLDFSLDIRSMHEVGPQRRNTIWISVSDQNPSTPNKDRARKNKPRHLIPNRTAIITRSTLLDAPEHIREIRAPLEMHML